MYYQYHGDLLHSIGRRCLPDGVPPPLVSLHVLQPAGRPRVRDLGAVVVPHPAVSVQELASVLLNHGRQVRITGVGLRQAHPVREVGHQLQVRKLLHKTSSNPRGVKEPLTVGLMVHLVVLLLLPGENISEELLRHVLGEVVLHSVAVDESRTELLGCHNLIISPALSPWSDQTNLLLEHPDMVLHQNLLVSLSRLGGRGEARVGTSKHQTLSRSHRTISEHHHDHFQLVLREKGFEPDMCKGVYRISRQTAVYLSLPRCRIHLSGTSTPSYPSLAISAKASSNSRNGLPALSPSVSFRIPHNVL